MNRTVILATVFMLAGTLLTTVIATAPTAYAGGDDYKEDKKKYRDGYDSNNKNKAEHDS